MKKLKLENALIQIGILTVFVCLSIFVLLPILTLFIKSFQDLSGSWIGFENYIAYINTPGIFNSIWNSTRVSLISSSIVSLLAYVYAYSLVRTKMSAKNMFMLIALIPVCSASMLPAISLIYLFGNQGILNFLMGEYSIYGSIGIIISQIFYCFPIVLLTYVSALTMSDYRLNEASQLLSSNKMKLFLNVNFFEIKYAVIIGFLFSFLIGISDYGIPQVIGGSENFLSTDIVKYIIGRQRFDLGAVIGVILLLPVLLIFFIQNVLNKGKNAGITSEYVKYPTQTSLFGNFSILLTVGIAFFILMIFSTSVLASFVTFWPYNLDLTLSHYQFSNFDNIGWKAWINSLQISFIVSAIGTFFILVATYLIEKTNELSLVRSLSKFVSLMPIAIPGLTLGVSYIFFFNSAINPLNFLYGTILILSLNTIFHFYYVGYIPITNSLRKLDQNFELVSLSLGVSRIKHFFKITIPNIMPIIINVFTYMFMYSMTAVSSILFLYHPNNKPLSVSTVLLYDAGFVASAAGMAIVISITSISIFLIQNLVLYFIKKNYNINIVK